jgi:hypothetical protein
MNKKSVDIYFKIKGKAKKYLYVLPKPPLWLLGANEPHFDEFYRKTMYPILKYLLF